MKSYSESEIIQVIVDTIQSKISFDTSIDDYQNIHLLGRDLGLHARGLIWLLFALQNRFGITFDEQDILQDRCYTLNIIAALIHDKISAKEEVLPTPH